MIGRKIPDPAYWAITERNGAQLITPRSPIHDSLVQNIDSAETHGVVGTGDILVASKSSSVIDPESIGIDREVVSDYKSPKAEQPSMGLRARRLALTGITVFIGMKLGEESIQLAAGGDYQIVSHLSNTAVEVGTAALRGVQEAIYPLTSRNMKEKTKEAPAADNTGHLDQEISQESIIKSQPKHIEAAQACINDRELEVVRDYFLSTGLVKIEELAADQPTKEILTPVDLEQAS